MRNGETLYASNSNGNPRDFLGKDIPIWTYDGARASDFVDQCEALGCTFVCSEWGVGDLETLRADPRVITVTCLREPFDRFLSTFIFDYRLGYTNCRNIAEYAGSKRSFSYYNYYTHMLARLDDGTVTVTLEDLSRAQRMLEQFDHVGIVGAPRWVDELGVALGWTVNNIRANKQGNAPLEILRNLMRGRSSTAKRILNSLRLEIAPDFRARFVEANWMDYAIFEQAQSMQRRA